MATYISKLKWAWQAYCLSPTLLIVKIYTFFKDVQMMLKHFFDISTGFRYKKMEKISPSIYRDVHVLGCCRSLFCYEICLRQIQFDWPLFGLDLVFVWSLICLYLVFDLPLFGLWWNFVCQLVFDWTLSCLQSAFSWALVGLHSAFSQASVGLWSGFGQASVGLRSAFVRPSVGLWLASGQPLWPFLYFDWSLTGLW